LTVATVEHQAPLTVSLKGRVALVTGASSGLGLHFAKVLSLAGASVAVAARRADRFHQLASEMSSDGAKAMAVQLDVTDAAQIPAALDAIESQLGTVDILVNNAGVPDAKFATKMSLELIDRVIDVNFRAPFLIAAEVARRLIAANRPGRIVNLSSAGAYYYAADSAASLYCASKAGVSRMTETLAMEWAKFNINVNAIAPGLFHSEMSEGMLERIGEDRATRGMPRKRIGEPHQLDSTILYLVSPASEFVTGIVIRVDDAQLPR
jgi:NAD(P)-dependent dehydrogenase (short-subunit alcohol dehydrogenase family)